jgi:hypothetical protein
VRCTLYNIIYGTLYISSVPLSLARRRASPGETALFYTQGEQAHRVRVECVSLAERAQWLRAPDDPQGLICSMPGISATHQLGACIQRPIHIYEQSDIHTLRAAQYCSRLLCMCTSERAPRGTHTNTSVRLYICSWFRYLK